MANSVSGIDAVLQYIKLLLKGAYPNFAISSGHKSGTRKIAAATKMSFVSYLQEH